MVVTHGKEEGRHRLSLFRVPDLFLLQGQALVSASGQWWEWGLAMMTLFCCCRAVRAEYLYFMWRNTARTATSGYLGWYAHILKTIIDKHLRGVEPYKGCESSDRRQGSPFGSLLGVMVSKESYVTVIERCSKCLPFRLWSCICMSSHGPMIREG